MPDGAHTATRRRARRIDIDVQLQIERLAQEGFGAAQILRQIERDHPEWIPRLPVLRTVQRMLEGLAGSPRTRSQSLSTGRTMGNISSEDALNVWRIQDATREETAIILPVLAAMIEQTNGRRDYLTTLEARWTTLIATGAPDLSPRWVAWLAAKCAVRQLRAGPGHDATSPYDKILALAPWRSDDAFQTFAEFVRRAHPEWLPRREGTGMEGAVMDACRIRAEITGTEVMDVVNALLQREDYPRPA